MRGVFFLQKVLTEEEKKAKADFEALKVNHASDLWLSFGTFLGTQSPYSHLLVNIVVKNIMRTSLLFLLQIIWFSYNTIKNWKLAYLACHT